MGFCDYVTLENAYQEYGVPEGGRFQTKSLFACGGEFTINRARKLVDHLYRIEESPDDINPHTGLALWKRIPIGDRVIDYHGDILLYYIGEADRSLELVARFTHGQLESIRPLEDYPEANRSLLMEQGAR